MKTFHEQMAVNKTLADLPPKLWSLRGDLEVLFRKLNITGDSKAMSLVINLLPTLGYYDSGTAAAIIKGCKLDPDQEPALAEDIVKISRYYKNIRDDRESINRFVKRMDEINHPDNSPKGTERRLRSRKTDLRIDALNRTKRILVDNMKLCAESTLSLDVERVPMDELRSISIPAIARIRERNNWSSGRLESLEVTLKIPRLFKQKMIRSGIMLAFSSKAKRYGLPLTADYMGTEEGVDIHKVRWLTWKKDDKEFADNRGYVCVHKEYKLAAAGGTVAQAKRSLMTVVRNEMMRRLHESV